MNENIRQLETRVEHEMSILSDLTDMSPESAVVARLKAGVLSEAQHYRQTRQRSRLRRVGSAIAAVILFAAALQWPAPSTSSIEEADAYVSDWIVYSDESAEYLTALFDDPASTEFEWDDDTSMDEFFEGMESTLGLDS